MKKFLVAMMAVMAIALTSCKHETCNLYVANNYSKSAVVLFSHDKDCSSIQEAEIAVHALPGKAYKVNQKVKLQGLYAIIYVCVGEEKEGDETLAEYKLQASENLSDFAGMANLTVFIDEKGMPGFNGQSL